MKLSRAANWMFGFGLLGWLTCTYIAPIVIKILFTPPVSFGTNCEPAADWSMDRLIQTQALGIGSFMVAGFFFDVWLRRRANRKDQVVNKPNNVRINESK